MAYQVTYDGNVGSVPVAPADHSMATIASGYAVTGTRSILIGQEWYVSWCRFRFPTPTASPAISMWVYLREDGWTNSGEARVLFHLTSDKYVGLYFDASNKTFDLYVDGVKVADGSANLGAQALFNLRMYGTISDTGSITVKMNGAESIAYNGDTNPGVSDLVDYVMVHSTSSKCYIYVSSLSLNDGGADPGDRRAQVLMPNGDDTVQWTPSTGSDNYAVVDEVGPNDSDYLETATNGYKDLLDLADFDGTDRTIAGVTKFARAWKTTADTQSLKNGIKSGTTEDSTEHELGTSALYYLHGMGENPDDSAAWEDGDIDDLLSLHEAVIP